MNICLVRQTPKNIGCEPPYPNHQTVVFSIREPDKTAHLWHEECKIEEPHEIKDCPLWGIHVV